MEDICKQAELERCRMSFHILFIIFAYFPVQQNAEAERNICFF